MGQKVLAIKMEQKSFKGNKKRSKENAGHVWPFVTQHWLAFYGLVWISNGF